MKNGENKMSKELVQFCYYLEETLHLGKIHYSKPYVYLYTSYSKFRINLTDRARLGRYAVYHMGDSRGQKENWHIQQYCNSIFYALFMNYTHDFRTEEGLSFTKETYYSFMRKFHRYQALLVIKDIFDRQDREATFT